MVKKNKRRYPNPNLKCVLYECFRINQIRMDISSLDTALRWWHFFWTAPCHHFSANLLPSVLAEIRETKHLANASLFIINKLHMGMKLHIVNFLKKKNEIHLGRTDV